MTYLGCVSCGCHNRVFTVLFLSVSGRLCTGERRNHCTKVSGHKQLLMHVLSLIYPLILAAGVSLASFPSQAHFLLHTH